MTLWRSAVVRKLPTRFLRTTRWLPSRVILCRTSRIRRRTPARPAIRSASDSFFSSCTNGGHSISELGTLPGPINFPRSGKVHIGIALHFLHRRLHLWRRIHVRLVSFIPSLEIFVPTGHHNAIVLACHVGHDADILFISHRFFEHLGEF